jgi:1-aminocyclopropane-1-carboxylate deaminase
VLTKLNLIKLDHPEFNNLGIYVSVLNLEHIGEKINGNKFFKLKYNLEQAIAEGKKKLLTFGGAYSNHIYATAAAGKEYNLQTIGIIRGDELNSNSNRILNAARNMGMEFKFVSRDEYRRKEEKNFIENLKNEFGNFYLLPEGGSNDLAVKGCAEIPGLVKEDFDWICCACGTGGTAAGIYRGLNQGQKVLGIPVLHASEYFETKIADLLSLDKLPENIILNHRFHFGGYAKSDETLRNFSENFSKDYGISLDPIYNSKMFYAIFKLISEGFFLNGEKVVCVNTGGNYEL